MSATAGVTDNPYAALGLGLKKNDDSSGKNALGQDAFLKLMTTQLQNQNPLKPTDNAEFLGQPAQISTVSRVQSLNDSLGALSHTLTSQQNLPPAHMVTHKQQL